MAQVVGTGTLTVALGGETLATLTAADGAQPVRFRSSAPVNALAFTYAPGAGDEGWAVLGDFTREGAGVAISFR